MVTIGYIMIPIAIPHNKLINSVVFCRVAYCKKFFGKISKMKFFFSQVFSHKDLSTVGWTNEDHISKFYVSLRYV